MQFRLQTLFLMTTLAAVIAWTFFAPPQWLGLLLIWLLYALLPAVTISGIVFHRGYHQAFFVGMAPWVVAVSLWFLAQFYSPWLGSLIGFNSQILDFTSYMDDDATIYLKMILAIPLTIAVASGFVGIGIRWWAVSTEKKAA